MPFEPYTIYKEALPFLKVGHIIKAGAGRKGGTGFWIVKRVNPGRFRYVETAARTRYPLNQQSSPTFNAVVGDLDVNRIVHLQYLSVETAVDVILYWGKDPFMAKDVEIPINVNLTPLNAPLMLDKWTYDQSMFLAITKAAPEQDFDFEMFGYIVEAAPEYTESRPPKKYLQITSEGNATFVES